MSTVRLALPVLMMLSACESPPAFRPKARTPPNFSARVVDAKSTVDSSGYLPRARRAAWAKISVEAGGSLHGAVTLELGDADPLFSYPDMASRLAARPQTTENYLMTPNADGLPRVWRCVGTFRLDPLGKVDEVDVEVWRDTLVNLEQASSPTWATTLRLTWK